MSIIWPIIGILFTLLYFTIVAGPLILIAVLFIWSRVERNRILPLFVGATNEQLERVYRAIESISCEPATCAVLVRTNRAATSKALQIPLPEYVRPWGGKTVIIADDTDVPAFALSDAVTPEPIGAGQVFRWLQIPRQRLKNGKTRNQFSPKRYVASNSGVMDALVAINPKCPMKLLAYLLSAGCDTFNFDPIHQARAGGYPDWLQVPEFPICDRCRKRMKLIIQIPGSLTMIKKCNGALFYVCGCAKHPEEIRTVVQFD